MSNGRRKILKLHFLFLLPFIFSSSVLLAQEDANARQKVEETIVQYCGINDPPRSLWLAEIGEQAVPILLEKLQAGRFSATIVEALGMIGDRRCVPVLIEMLNNIGSEAERFYIIAALAHIADPAAEQAILDNFEQAKSQNNPWQLEIALALLKVASESTRQKVKEITSYVQDLYQRSMWTFNEQAQEQIFEELNNSAFKNEEIVYALLASLIIDLRDEELLTKAIRYRQLIDESGPRFTEGFNVLTEIGNAQTFETIYKFAENNQELWPPAPPNIAEEERQKYFTIPPLVRVSAIEALLNTENLDMTRISQTFANMSPYDFKEIPLTVKFEPDEWNYQWAKETVSFETINCYLGNLPGYQVSDIKPETIKLNNQLSIICGSEILEQKQGFLGKVLKVKINKLDALKSLGNLYPGTKCLVTINGEIKDGKYFRKNIEIEVDRYLSATLKIHSDKWNINWYNWIKENIDKSKIIKHFVGKANILCLIKDLKDYEGNSISVEEINPESIRLNYTLAPQPFSCSKDKKLAVIIGRGRKHHWEGGKDFNQWCDNEKTLKEFPGPIMLVKFNKFQTMQTLSGTTSGKEYNITVSGNVKTGQPFEANAKITLTEWKHGHKWNKANPAWLNCDNDQDNWWNKDEEFENSWKYLRKSDK